MKTYISKKALCAIMCGLLCSIAGVSLVGCQSSSSSTASNTATQDTVPTTITVSTADEATNTSDALKQLGLDAKELEINPEITYSDKEVGFQLELPKEGDTIAILHTSAGDITMRFFSEEAPKTVTNFINLAKGGGYDNTSFYRVVNDFMIQGGDVNQASSYGADFSDEFCDKLYNIRGAVSMANSAADTNSSQFFINQKDSDAFALEGGWTALEANWENIKTQLLNYKDTNLLSSYIEQYGSNCYDTELVPDTVRSLYETYGGNPHLDGAYNIVDRGHTVFAQVIDGMDVVDKIAAVETDENDKPLNDITIKTVEITTYSAVQEVSTVAETTVEETTVAETTNSEE